MKLFITVIAAIFLLQGCATGKGISHFPDRESEKCDNVTWYNPQNSSVSGWTIPYYIIPLWYERWDKSEDDLSVEIYFKVDTDNRDHLSTSDVYLKSPENTKPIEPSSVKISSDGSYENSRFLMYKLEFPIAAGSVEEFELVFSREIFGCTISPIHYKKSEYDFNGQIL